MDDNKTKALQAALAQIEKQFGKGSIMKMDSQALQDVQVVSTGSLGLDIALGVGGLPRGRVIEIYGPESSGKTTLTLQVIAEAQKMGGTAAFEEEVETFITWVKSAKPQVGVAEVLAPGEPERARKLDREKNGVPIDSTTWQQLVDVARKVRLNDTEIPQTAGA